MMAEKNPMTFWRKQAEESAAFVLERTGIKPVLGLMTGTGLGGSLSGMERDFAADYAEIPGFPVSTVAGHAGRLLTGRLGGKPIVAMEGRFHLYEGYTPAEVTLPVRVMQAMGVKTLIITNAAGGLNPDFVPGDIMVISDHINLTGENPLAGPNDEAWGIRFPDMARVYSKRLAAAAIGAGAEAGLVLRQGVYLGLKGPSLETPAETRFIRMIGADAVGMSTVQEAIAAVHARMNILGLSTITNVNDPDRPEPATVEEIIRVADAAAGRLSGLITDIAGKIDA